MKTKQHGLVAWENSPDTPLYSLWDMLSPGEREDWAKCEKAVLDAFRDQIERDGAVKALRLLTEQCSGDWAGIGLCAMRQSARQIKEKIESGEVRL